MGIRDKNNYLKQLTSQLRFRSVDLGKRIEGSTPPSAFIGSWNYPKVLAGPLLVPELTETSRMDSPEDWIPSQNTIEDIIGYRLSMVRGKHEVNVTDVDNRIVSKLQETVMSRDPIPGCAEFVKKPSGMSFNDHHTPHGPSGEYTSYETDNCRWDKDMEKAHYDTDLKARDAVLELYDKSTPFSRIQKAFSVGSFGAGRRRRLVPTRWSITACDTTLADSLSQEVRNNESIDYYRVHEFESLNNYYAIILTPTPWQYEWMEAFLHVLGREEVLFTDHEWNNGKKGYSTVGGCYYSCKFGVLEGLAREGIQAGAIVLREAYEGYVPLGVFNVRENVRAAMNTKPSEHSSLGEALDSVEPRLRLGVDRFIRDSSVLREELRSRQLRLSQFT
ncbi:MAG: hypothetical protein ABIH11_08540 [Candidatus Altiarchaeota archaeon]